MVEFFRSRRNEIEAYLRDLFLRKQHEFSRINGWGSDLCDRLLDFAVHGKMIRGGLVSLGYALFRGDPAEQQQQQLTAAAAAMELFQSALLVHDDIMDRDTTRRGLASLYFQYAELADRQGLNESYHLGESLGICAGDVAFFLAFEILAGLKIDPDTYRRILALTAKEIGYVGVAQMQDIYNGAADNRVTDADILRLYLYKTGRYTFSLPLILGGILAGRPEADIELLEELGESIGIVFQIRDDELGLFGNQTETGKPVGSDIREGKKTLYFSYLNELAEDEDRIKLSHIFGSQDLSAEDIRFVQDLTKKLGIRETVQKLAAAEFKRANALLRQLPEMVPEFSGTLQELLDYTMERTK
jgi:geranylgeranyl diphosphate synthase type I